MKKSELKQLINEVLQEENKVDIKFICTGGGRVQTMNSEARSAEIRKGDIIQIYRENQYNYFGSPILQPGMRFKHDAGLSGKNISNEFPDTSGLEVAINKEYVGTNLVDDDFWATFEKANENKNEGIMKKSELKQLIREILQEGINVKNVGEAKILLKKNGIQVTSHKYANGNEGYIETNNNSKAVSLLRSMGLWKP